MTEWDWEYLSMNDEDFAYATGLSRTKIEQFMEQAKADLKEIEMTGTELTAQAIDEVEAFVKMVNRERPNLNTVMILAHSKEWTVERLKMNGLPIWEVFITPRVSAMVWFDEDGGHAEW